MLHPLYCSHFHLGAYPKEKLVNWKRIILCLWITYCSDLFALKSVLAPGWFSGMLWLWCTILKAPLQAFTGREYLVAMATTASLEIVISLDFITMTLIFSSTEMEGLDQTIRCKCCVFIFSLLKVCIGETHACKSKTVNQKKTMLSIAYREIKINISSLGFVSS